VKPRSREFPELGFGGDHTGARRTRRAFRLCVAAVVLFAATLWFSECFLRYPSAERLYLSGLTLPNNESGRVMLRQAVKIDNEKNESPSPKYLQALAEREESDKILAAYKTAYEIDPRNSFLAIRYGCCLFAHGEAAAALDRFREAALHPPENALPGYLQAAVLPWVDEASRDRLADSLALVARTNGSNESVIFPRPLWFPTLPQGGERYAELRRQIAQECCAPLYRYTDWIAEAAASNIEKRRVHLWNSRLETLETMGERIAASRGSGTIQAIAGLRIQLQASTFREQVAQLDSSAPDRTSITKRMKLESALEQLTDFEKSRDPRITVERVKYDLPNRLVWRTAWVFAACYALAYALTKLARTGRASWALPHTPLGKAVFLGGAGLMLILLHTAMVFQRTSGESIEWIGSLEWIWWILAAALVVFGPVYPFTALPSARTICEKYGPHEKTDGMERAAKRCWRVAYLSLVRRYYGILGGAFLCVISIWVINHRLLVALYPWQKVLLTTGLQEEETQAVQQALALLQ